MPAVVCRSRSRRCRPRPPLPAAVIDVGDSSRRRPLPPPLTMVDPGLPRSSRLVAEALGTGTISAELTAIPADHSWTIRKDGSAHTPEERTSGGLHSFLSHLALGEVPVPGL